MKDFPRIYQGSPRHRPGYGCLAASPARPKARALHWFLERDYEVAPATPLGSGLHWVFAEAMIRISAPCETASFEGLPTMAPGCCKHLRGFFFLFVLVVVGTAPYPIRSGRKKKPTNEYYARKFVGVHCRKLSQVECPAVKT